MPDVPSSVFFRDENADQDCLSLPHGYRREVPLAYVGFSLFSWSRGLGIDLLSASVLLAGSLQRAQPVYKVVAKGDDWTKEHCPFEKALKVTRFCVQTPVICAVRVY